MDWSLTDSLYYLISHLRSTPDERPLSCDRCQCCGLQCDSLICISVLEEDVGNPDTLQLNIKFEIEYSNKNQNQRTSKSDMMLRASFDFKL